jgi:hypothetical protein
MYSEPKINEEKKLVKDMTRKVMIYARPLLLFA